MLLGFLFVRAVAITPAETVGCCRLLVLQSSAFSLSTEDRLPRCAFSELARRSLRVTARTLAESLKRPFDIRGFLWIRYLLHHSNCFRLVRPVAGWEFHPRKIQTIMTHVL